ncbi:hypothetical protein [Metabacillus arenae]|uniref:Uncharacterized protein n=1 Tax=Metabacillus arenae TaxID=2771434 RepID=A0A926RY17_9BACI|nr:hypothetical protein [Metabacillus arenae]MBD1381571.1 hypothetical protein [Metabacillus arenae]
MAETGYIKVVRKKELYGMFRSYEILLNEELAGKLPRGKELVLEVPAGTHTLQNKMDWIVTDPLKVEVSAGETAVFQVGGKVKGIADQDIHMIRLEE